jgi:hypothetical protein
MVSYFKVGTDGEDDDQGVPRAKLGFQKLIDRPDLQFNLADIGMRAQPPLDIEQWLYSKTFSERPDPGSRIRELNQIRNSNLNSGSEFTFQIRIRIGIRTSIRNRKLETNIRWN